MLRMLLFSKQSVERHTIICYLISEVAETASDISFGPIKNGLRYFHSGSKRALKRPIPVFTEQP